MFVAHNTPTHMDPHTKRGELDSADGEALPDSVYAKALVRDLRSVVAQTSGGTDRGTHRDRVDGSRYQFAGPPPAGTATPAYIHRCAHRQPARRRRSHNAALRAIRRTGPRKSHQTCTRVRPARSGTRPVSARSASDLTDGASVLTAGALRPAWVTSAAPRANWRLRKSLPWSPRRGRSDRPVRWWHVCGRHDDTCLHLATLPYSTLQYPLALSRADQSEQP
jgi:hypothetical protein